MLSENSILRRLPPGLDQRQLVFLEGIRHCAEIVWLAYLRLERVLTSIADGHVSGPLESERYTEAFMDAWAVVDAIDRFRQLWARFPGMQFAEQPEGHISFAQASADVRGLRNVTDHLAQRADYVAASGNPVMGLLAWVTLKASEPQKFNCCLLAPGTMKKSNWRMVNPAGMELTSYATGRTGLIHLAAGEYRADLTSLIPEMKDRVNELERGLEAFLRQHGLEGQQAGTDFFIALEGCFSDPLPI